MSEQPIVPMYERAEITPRELAALRRKLRETLAEVQTARAGVHWTYDPEYGSYECSGCKNVYLFDLSTAEDAGYKFCPACGGRIERFVVPAAEGSEE